MYYILIREINIPKKGWFLLGRSSLLPIAKILHEYKLGMLRDLSMKLRNLPAEFGPIQERMEAEFIKELLVEQGAVVYLRES